MKDIGHTESGGYLVEMNRAEYHEFRALQDAIEGEGLPVFDGNRFGFREEFDFSKTFYSIRAFYLMAFQVNQFQTLLNDIREALHIKKEN